MKAIFICGPESSGNRILTDIFIANGYWGFSGHEQPTIEELPPDKDVVILRSQPHNKKFINIHSFVEELKKKFDEVHLVVPMRRADIVVRSQVKNGHSRDLDHASEKLYNAMVMLGRSELPYYPCQYERLISYPEMTLYMLSNDLEIPPLELNGIELKNGNKKYE